MRTVAITAPDACDQALDVLRAGGLVVCPTETVYGLLADCENPDAVSRLLRFKRRPAGKAISLAVNDINLARRYVQLNDQAEHLYATLLPGPVTIVSQATHIADNRLESEFGTLGIRLPDYPFLRQLVAKYGHALTATSANAHGRKTPYSPQDILDHTSASQQNLLDLILDAGTLPPNPPSLVIDTTASTPIVMRAHHDYQQFSSQKTTSYCTNSPKETQALAGKILQPYLPVIAHSGLLITLDGDLGVGKTTLTQGFAQFLGIADHVNSPTYTYLKEYHFHKFDQQGTLYHLDVWTLDRPEMLDALDLPSLMHPGALIIIEWYHQIASLLHPTLPTLHLELRSTAANAHAREIIVQDLSKNTAVKE